VFDKCTSPDYGEEPDVVPRPIGNFFEYKNLIRCLLFVCADSCVDCYSFHDDPLIVLEWWRVSE